MPLRRLSCLSFLLVFLSCLNAQSQNCRFIFKGTLAGKNITMCFYPDNNDGNVRGEYSYELSGSGFLYFAGTSLLQKNGEFIQNLEEQNEQGDVTGYLRGTLKNGVMTGNWSSKDGKKSFTYRLTLQKTNR